MIEPKQSSQVGHFTIVLCGLPLGDKIHFKIHQLRRDTHTVTPFCNQMCCLIEGKVVWDLVSALIP